MRMEMGPKITKTQTTVIINALKDHPYNKKASESSGAFLFFKVSSLEIALHRRKYNERRKV